MHSHVSSTSQIFGGVDTISIYGGTFSQTTHAPDSPSLKDELLTPKDTFYERVALDALVDAGERFAAPQCSEFTRQEIIKRIKNWANSDSSRSGIFWLYSGAGAGKSALAQTLAQEFKESGRLAASFFFCRSIGSRSNGDHLIPTLVFQLFEAIPDIRPIIEEKIRSIPALFTKTREFQMKALFIEPLVSHCQANPTLVYPLLIVIDGLDECQNPDTQCDLLKILAEAIPQLPYPFRFLIASRPEAHIVKTFDHEKAFKEIRNSVTRYNLSDDPDAVSDIRFHLYQKFESIRQSHVLRARLQGWPDQTAVETLVDWSSKHFIYASTAMAYIESPHHEPDQRLEVILGRFPPPSKKDKPFARLDSLYDLIYESLDKDHLNNTLCTLGLLRVIEDSRGIEDGLFRWGTGSKILFFECSPISSYRGTIYIINHLLKTQPGPKSVELLLNPLRSLVSLDDHHIYPLHKSLFDYLLDSERSGAFHVDLRLSHKFVARYIIRNWAVLGKTRAHAADPTQFTVGSRFDALIYHLTMFAFKRSRRALEKT